MTTENNQTPKPRKTTDIHLCEELILRNTENKYDALIERSRNKGYHDFKFDTIQDHPEYGDCTCPKHQLVADLNPFPELEDIRKRVIDGEFDESPDDEDKERMRQDLKENGGEALFEMLGLNEKV